MSTKQAQAIARAASVMGRVGGRAGKGAAKARTTEQARRAGQLGAAKRWGRPQTSEPA